MLACFFCENEENALVYQIGHIGGRGLQNVWLLIWWIQTWSFRSFSNSHLFLIPWMFPWLLVRYRPHGVYCIDHFGDFSHFTQKNLGTSMN